MLRSLRTTQLFRQAPGYDGLFRASLRRSFVNRPTARSIAELRNPSTVKSSRLARPQITSLHPASIFRSARNVRRNGTKASPNAEAGRTAPRSLSDRMKQMSKKYGWTVVGIYLGLSVLDFPFCFLAVRLFGTERIGHVEHVLIDGFWGLLESAIPGLKERREKNEAEAEVETGQTAGPEGDTAAITPIKPRGENASIWTQLIIAYGVHKSLIFFRIPLTVAITPRVVKVLRGWGWKIGNTATKAT